MSSVSEFEGTLSLRLVASALFTSALLNSAGHHCASKHCVSAGLVRAGERRGNLPWKECERGFRIGSATRKNEEVRHLLSYVEIRVFFPSKVFASQPDAHHGPHLCVAVLPL
ncbi:hypothetical protein NQZ68_031654 [Dissostichus eleginoides]|nr:hypothetical protein NQZ68_031654 [Dissostichus eleginoides]